RHAVTARAASPETELNSPESGVAPTAFRLEHALRRGREFRQLLRRPHRPWSEVAAAIGAAPAEPRLDAVAAERAFERAYHGVGRRRRQIPVAAFTIRAQRKHAGSFLLCVPRQ